jgi:type II secretory ATPase GspE/PulE/Tfp pilus assembly ATPase PilB-like protein
MECAQAEDLLVALTRGELPPDQAQEVQAHLAGCAQCSALLNATQRTSDVLGEVTSEAVAKTVADVFERAITEGASDIHIERVGAHARVSLRIDGVLRQALLLPDRALSPLIAHLHVLAHTNPLETRVPQYGTIVAKHEGRDYDLRTAIVPAYSGPRATLRVLPLPGDSLTLDQMSIAPEHLAAIRHLVRQPTGLVVISGPTGSGKTTTAYACLRDLVHPEISVFSVEDPVAMVLEGVTQLCINPTVGFDHPAALRAVMQSDPDVILAGDIPDLDSGTAVCELAMTGHMVLAGLHADDAPSTVTRLIELGLPAYSLASSLVGVVSQRLVRKVCQECKREYDLPAGEIAFLHSAGVADVPRRLWRGAGCAACRSQGYSGQAPINEVLLVNRDITAAIAHGRYTPEVGRAAVATSLMRDAADKAVAGLTTVKEARRVTGA